MTLSRAIVWTDHHTAHVLQYDADQVVASHVKAHAHPTGQHGSAVRTEHEFFGHICDALGGVSEVLVVGPKTGVADFERYATKHRPQTARRIVGCDVVDHPTENQLVAHARQWFLQRDRMAGVPTPT
jgi:hypothetical protein